MHVYLLDLFKRFLFFIYNESSNIIKYVIYANTIQNKLYRLYNKINNKLKFSVLEFNT